MSFKSFCFLNNFQYFFLFIPAIRWIFSNKNKNVLILFIYIPRKARCFLALKKHDLAIKAFRSTISALDESKLSTEKRQKWQKDIQIMLLMLQKNHQGRP